VVLLVSAAALAINGVLGPLVEETYFRGHLCRASIARSLGLSIAVHVGINTVFPLLDVPHFCNRGVPVSLLVSRRRSGKPSARRCPSITSVPAGRRAADGDCSPLFRSVPARSPS
jgi:membrane protease YdiL (CAAX protease family)